MKLPNFKDIYWKSIKELEILQKYQLVPIIPRNKECIEVHADGVKEVKCDFCNVNCGNDFCYTNQKEEK